MYQNALRISFIAAAVIGVSVIGWSEFARAQSGGKSSGAAVGKATNVIGYLETRDRRIELKTGGLYTVMTKSGKVIAENVTLKQLQANYPELHGVLQRSIASENYNNDARLYRNNDARLLRGNSALRSQDQTLSGTVNPLR
jgi:hypothetical protein